MTVPPAAIPAPTSLVDPSSAGGPATAAAALPAQTAAVDFTALLQGLTQANQPVAAASPAMTSPPADASTPALPAMPGPATARDPPPEEPRNDKPDGQPLQADGKDLPPTGLEALLASLAVPGSAPASAPAPPDAEAPDEAPQPASAFPVTAQSAAAPPTKDATPATPGESAAEPPVVAANDGAEPRAGRDAQKGDTTARSQAISTDPAPQSADAQLKGTLARAPEAQPQPQAEFHARLATLLNAGPRPAADGGAGSSISIVAPPQSALPGSAHASPAGTSLDSLPALRPLSDQQAWSQGLADRILVMADKGLQSATLRLEPEHLGPMQIRVQVASDGATQVLFSAHHSQTRDALENAIPRLRDLFAEQGLNLMQANVDSGRSAFAGRDFSALAPWQRWGGEEASDATARAPAVWQVVRSSAHRVDVFV